MAAVEDRIARRAAVIDALRAAQFDKAAAVDAAADQLLGAGGTDGAADGDGAGQHVLEAAVGDRDGADRDAGQILSRTDTADQLAARRRAGIDVLRAAVRNGAGAVEAGQILGAAIGDERADGAAARGYVHHRAGAAHQRAAGRAAREHELGAGSGDRAGTVGAAVGDGQDAAGLDKRALFRAARADGGRARAHHGAAGEAAVEDQLGAAEADRAAAYPGRPTGSACRWSACCPRPRCPPAKTVCVPPSWKVVPVAVPPDRICWASAPLTSSLTPEPPEKIVSVAPAPIVPPILVPPLPTARLPPSITVAPLTRPLDATDTSPPLNQVAQHLAARAGDKGRAAEADRRTAVGAAAVDVELGAGLDERRNHRAAVLDVQHRLTATDRGEAGVTAAHHGLGALRADEHVDRRAAGHVLRAVEIDRGARCRCRRRKPSGCRRRSAGRRSPCRRR